MQNTWDDNFAKCGRCKLLTTRASYAATDTYAASIAKFEFYATNVSEYRHRKHFPSAECRMRVHRWDVSATTCRTASASYCVYAIKLQNGFIWVTQPENKIEIIFTSILSDSFIERTIIAETRDAWVWMWGCRRHNWVNTKLNETLLRSLLFISLRKW